MTREEAINKLNWALDNNSIEDVQSAYDYIIALKMAIKALEQQAILEKIKEVVCKWKDDSFTDGFSWDCMKEIADIVDEVEK